MGTLTKDVITRFFFERDGFTIEKSVLIMAYAEKFVFPFLYAFNLTSPHSLKTKTQRDNSHVCMLEVNCVL
jgi:hypothetical protein